MTASHLKLVNTDTGEVQETCAECEALMRKLKASWAREEQLKRDIEQEHMDHPERDVVERLHAYWKQACHHPNSGLDMGAESRFEAYLKALKMAKRVKGSLKGELDVEAVCRRAIDGAAYDPFCKTARNGFVERFDDPTTIFKNLRAFESFLKRAPRQAA